MTDRLAELRSQETSFRCLADKLAERIAGYEEGYKDGYKEGYEKGFEDGVEADRRDTAIVKAEEKQPRRDITAMVRVELDRRGWDAGVASESDAIEIAKTIKCKKFQVEAALKAIVTNPARKTGLSIETAKTFLPRRPGWNRSEVHHSDGNPTNNALDNLVERPSLLDAIRSMGEDGITEDALAGMGHKGFEIVRAERRGEVEKRDGRVYLRISDESQ